nr:immunoglobulin heavy chain junction region [Macaca mulatta]MOV54398.1 immunoglobulin heavy chain junction region [Macaca mulatta]MOV54508.1 immunoglobulin heavy chain junction region [Macaca mulatta]MOV54849.1 immunoglobulin heavy chain junction region [Macaca mulatta]MOV55076.1 immunoglobulin heavy chain junction region [Macaca mulatta]
CARHENSNFPPNSIYGLDSW